MTDKARRANEHANLPKLAGNDFDKILARVERIAPPGEVDYYSLVVLSRDLVQHRNWLGKLERLVELTHPDQKEEALALLDGVFADLFGVPSALQDVLGYQRNLAAALCAIADLCEGRFIADKSDARDQIAILGPLIANGRLEETRKSLMDRLLRQLASSQPLNRSDPSREREAFREVAQRLFRPAGLLGGPPTAEALTRRFVFLQEAGGKAGLRQSVAGVVTNLADPLLSVLYLLELAASSMGAELSNEILTGLLHIVKVDDLDEMVPQSWPPKDKLLRITRIYDFIGASAALAESDRAHLLDCLDRVLSLYIKRERIIEKLDDPSAHLRDRTIRLLEFCAARVLPPASKAQGVARERVVALLKQPNFEIHFVDGIASPARCEEALRGLHALLARGGFR